MQVRVQQGPAEWLSLVAQDQPFARGAYTGFFAPGVMSVPSPLVRGIKSDVIFLTLYQGGELNSLVRP